MKDTRSGERSQSNKALLLTILAAIALVTYAAMNHLVLDEVLGNFFQRGTYKSLVYLAWIGCGFAVFSAVLLTARMPGLLALLLVSCASLATNYVFADVVKQEITPDYMEWMVHELHQVPQAWGEFKAEILAAVFKTAALLAVFLLIRAAIYRYHLLPPDFLAQRRVRAIAFASFAGFHGAAMLLQPSYTVAETNLFVFGMPAALTTEMPERRDVAVRPEAAPRAEKIVLIIDESVGHKVYGEVIAPALPSLPVIDYGEAASIAACSAPSNALLRWGVEIQGLEHAGYDTRVNPSIWAYARAAGFRTALIDGQSKGAKQNFVNTRELELAGEFVPADTGVDSDHRIAQMLVERLQRPGRDLIYVVKRGSHFPYDTKYPKGTLPDDAPLAAKYAAAVSYTTGNFFRLLTARLPLQNLLLVYTSDHGQHLGLRAYHCSGTNHPDEYSVPLVVLSDAPAMTALLRPAASEMRNRASHANIFSTLLYGMGYSKSWSDETYGPSLAGPASGYLWVDGWLPHPTRQRSTVKFMRTPGFPGRDADHKARDSTAQP